MNSTVLIIEKDLKILFWKYILTNFYLEMDELGSGTEMDENTGCAGPGSDTKKVCILYFCGA